MQKQMHAFFKGMVQGVGFRYSTERIARKFQVSGFVCNCEDGRVELMVEGEEEELQDFLKAITHSHLGMFIRDKQVEWKEFENRWQRFEVKA